MFVSDRDSNYEIYIMNLDGKVQRNLTKNMKWDGLPQFSPDGSKIVYVSSMDGVGDIYIMDIDGNQKVNLTKFDGDDDSPQFSPTILTHPDIISSLN